MTAQYFFNTENARKVYSDLNRTDGIYEIRAKLIQTAARNGLSFFEAEALADDLLEGVRFCQNTTQALWSDAEGCLNDFVRSLNFIPHPETTVNMLFAGIKLMEDLQFKKVLKDDPEAALEYIAQADFPESHEEKLAFVIQTLRSFNVNGETLHTITQQLSYTDHPMQTMMDLARENLSRNALAALEIYLHCKEELTPQMAAVVACSFQDSRDLNEAIQAGRAHREYISGEIEAIYILALVIAAIALIYLSFHGEVLWGLAIAAAMAALYGIPFALRKVIANVLGRAKVEYVPSGYTPVQRTLPDTIHC